MFKSIRWKIFFPFTLLIISTMTISGLILSNYVRQVYIDDLEAKQVAEANLIGEAVVQSEGVNWEQLVLDAEARNWAKVLDARITVITPDGRVIGESDEDRASMDNHLNRPEIQLALSQGFGSSIRFSHTVGYEMMYTAVTKYIGDQLTGFVRVAVPLNKIEEKVASLQKIITVIILVLIILGMLLSSFISFRITRPLRYLTTAVQGLVPGSTPSEVTKQKGDEIAHLTHSFNGMARQIETQIGELESERARLAAVLDKMNDGVLIVDQEGMVQLINPAAEMLFGVPPDRDKNESLVKLTQDYQPVELWRACIKSGETQSSKFELGNQNLHLLAVATPLGASMPGHVLLLFQDISKQVQVDNMRRDFIGNVSHELRTPLAGIKALTETLQDGALEDPPAARKFLNMIETEVDSLNLMVAELLELSRIESGRVPLQFKKTRAGDIIKPAFERLHIQAERAQLEMTIDCPEDLPDVLADQDRLQQVVVNILHNAIKYTPEGGRILVKARLAGQYLEYSVQDSGKGIPASDLPRIFERFYKVDKSRSSSGTGLGLAIAKHMVEAHRGRIWADSEEGKGSTFHFTIPID